jgi:hypothetical protein
MPNLNTPPTPETLSAMIDSIKVYYADNEKTLSQEEQKLVASLPTKNRIVYDMDDSQREVLYRSVRHIWKEMTGKEPDFQTENKDAENLDGAYWMFPGGILVSGFNHFQAAKENKLLVCSMLDINPIVFEKMIAAGDPNEVIMLLIARGGVRTLINREKSEVIMQTNEESWPWVKDKLEKMYHKNKIAKVVDLSQPFEGWETGVTVRVKNVDTKP